jgi:hypothetical protein
MQRELRVCFAQRGQQRLEHDVREPQTSTAVRALNWTEALRDERAWMPFTVSERIGERENYLRCSARSVENRSGSNVSGARKNLPDLETQWNPATAVQPAGHVLFRCFNSLVSLPHEIGTPCPA